MSEKLTVAEKVLHIRYWADAALTEQFKAPMMSKLLNEYADALESQALRPADYAAGIEAAANIAHNAGWYSIHYSDNEPPEDVVIHNNACWQIRDSIRALSRPSEQAEQPSASERAELEILAFEAEQRERGEQGAELLSITRLSNPDGWAVHVSGKRVDYRYGASLASVLESLRLGTAAPPSKQEAVAWRLVDKDGNRVNWTDIKSHPPRDNERVMQAANKLEKSGAPHYWQPLYLRPARREDGMAPDWKKQAIAMREIVCEHIKEITITDAELAAIDEINELLAAAGREA